MGWLKKEYKCCLPILFVCSMECFPIQSEQLTWDLILCPHYADATKITLAPSNADVNQGENVTLQCHASHDPTMDLTFTWALNGIPLDLEDSSGPFRRVQGVSLMLPALEAML